MPKWQARSKPPQPCPWCTGTLQEFSGNVPSIIVYTLQNTARRGIGSVICPKCEYLCSDVFVSEYTSFLGVGLHFNLQLRKCRNTVLLDALVTVRRRFVSAIAKDDYNESASSHSIPVHLPTHPLIMLPSGALPTPIQF